MTHTFAANFTAGDFHAATLADNAFVLNLFVPTTRTFVVFHRPKRFLAEQAIALGLEGAVVDGFRLLDFAMRPRADVFRGGHPDTYFIEQIAVSHD